MRRVVVLGSTGSIGVQALQVVAATRDLCVSGLSCDRNVSLLLEQAGSMGVTDLAVADERAAAAVPAALYPELRVRAGREGAARLVREVEADLVLNGIVGFAGLEASLAALDGGRTLALANKESLVCAGSLVTGRAADRGVAILPVDSEHSALYQLLAAVGREAVESVVITASGGPFRGRDRVGLAGVTREQALAHPTWSMGEKITVDSATLMNKGLEVIEAHHLFGLPYEKIEVVLHPQSIVHALVRMKDGALLAHLGSPDMRVPISYALHHPHRAALGSERLDLSAGLTLDFGAPDEETFPAIRLAREAGVRGDAATCALNAANEVAVRAFLKGELSFLGINSVVEHVVLESDGGPLGTYEDVAAVDEWARRAAEQACRRCLG
ncbi:MAG: 1-deoxy-D-xylulose-5-phosphate reductoisomerase [Actinobacteria bacterium]|jgi:1-deoxy-D-xylulose-5-phosphate reductoisomerase|nr:1-deoxy-D-xylulose-5-phosphate reductoisomerase [Actinomycetota bacterium]